MTIEEIVSKVLNEIYKCGCIDDSKKKDSKNIVSKINLDEKKVNYMYEPDGTKYYISFKHEFNKIWMVVIENINKTFKRINVMMDDICEKLKKGQMYEIEPIEIESNIKYDTIIKTLCETIICYLNDVFDIFIFYERRIKYNINLVSNYNSNSLLFRFYQFFENENIVTDKNNNFPNFNYINYYLKNDIFLPETRIIKSLINEINENINKEKIMKIVEENKSKILNMNPFDNAHLIIPFKHYNLITDCIENNYIFNGIRERIFEIQMKNEWINNMKTANNKKITLSIISGINKKKDQILQIDICVEF